MPTLEEITEQIEREVFEVIRDNLVGYTNQPIILDKCRALIINQYKNSGLDVRPVNLRFENTQEGIAIVWDGVKIMAKVDEKKKIPYGDWGYGLQTPIADQIQSEIDRRKKLRKNAKGSLDALIHGAVIEELEKIVDDIGEVEENYSKMIDRKVEEDRHSGFGRGDSMG